MKKIALLFFVLNAFVLCAQTPQPGTKQWIDQQQRNSNPTLQNGNGSLGFLFDSTDCGLNYTQASVKLGQRFPLGCCPPASGVAQPAPFPITNIPFCAQTVKAYLWCVVAGNGTPITVTITDPLGNVQNFPMTIIGQDMDMCWGYAGAYAYRADVTSIANGNGNYIISGLPVDPGAINHSNDVNGATLMVIYKDPTVTYTGSIHIDDGCMTAQHALISHTMTGFNSCANAASGNTFMVIADLQGAGAQVSMNSAPLTAIAQQDWWNFVSSPVALTQSQASCDYSLNTSGDCATIAVTGLYTQTSCSNCVPAPSGLTITTASITTATCPGNGAATIAITGGSGNYSVTWNTIPAQTGLSATNLPGGIYTASIVDSTAGVCSLYSVTIPYNGPVAVVSTAALSCSSPGSATANVTGGTPPYSYSWSPMGGTAATANNLPAGIYTVYVTDSTGCTVSAVDSVLNAATLTLAISTSSAACGSSDGFATVSATGLAPYSYLWQPGGDTTAWINNLTAGTYTVNVTDNSGCSVSSLVVINTSELTATTTSPFFTVGCGESLTLLVGSNTSSAIFSWQPSTYLSNPNLQNPVVTPYTTITYTITVTTPCDTAITTIHIMIDTVNHRNEPICMLTVDTAIHKNVVVWERTNSPAHGFYKIYRETSTNVYTPIAMQPVQQLTMYTDMSSTSTNYPDRYRISTVDSCGFESTLSPYQRGLFLQVSYATPSGYNLAWTYYEGLPVVTHRIYRGTSPSNLTFLTNVSASSSSYTDANPPSAGLIYMVEAIHSNSPCISTPPYTSTYGSFSNLAYTTTIGINENEFSESVIISPNPGNGTFQLGFSLVQAQEIQIIVYDQLGRNVYSQRGNAAGGAYSTTMDLSSLSSGVYSVLVKTAQGFAAKRLVID